MKIIVDGQLVNYNDQGSGRIVLLLHGWGVTLDTFNDLAAHLSTEYRVLRIDFPGFGASPKPVDDWHVDDYAKLVTGFLNKLNIVDLHAVIGHSFGGRVILKAVGKGYINPTRLVLIGSAGVKPSVTGRQYVYRAAAKLGKAATAVPGLKRLRAGSRRRLYKKIGATDYLEAGGLKQIFLHVINEDLRADASHIKQPSLLLWGEHDDATPVRDGQTLTDIIGNARLVVLPDAGHFVYLEALDVVTKNIEEFLR